MATRAILRRRKALVSAWTQPTSSFRYFKSFEHGQSSPVPYSQDPSWAVVLPSVESDSENKRESSPVTKDKIQFYSSAGLLRNHFGGNPALRSVDVRLYYGSSIGATWLSQSLRYSSTATAGQPDFPSGNDKNEDKAAAQSKDPSPEECDQAVEGLSSAKAKAKAKQTQELRKSDKTVLQRVWATLLGIGPALRAVASMSRGDWVIKLRHWKDEFISTMQHYWLGTKLLWADVRICSRLLLKLASGKSLSRRERQQLTRTTADIFRLVPVAVFILVPFMEFLLPVFLKLFPNMLPSTFQDKMKEQEDLKRRLNARIEYAKFLQETVKEMAKEVQNSRSGEIKQTAEDLDEFMNNVRRGEDVSNEEILGFAKLFNDELTLDNISRPRLVNMCKYMGIMPFGADAYLRFMLRQKLRKIKEDDRMIQAEGVESLSEAELRQACRDRGLLGLLSVEEMRQQLRDWLDLSLNHSVPSSLLILSRAFNISGKIRPEEAVEAALSSLPDEVVDTVGATSLPSEDTVSERRRKLEFLEMQEELIKEEEGKKKAEEEKAKLKESPVVEKDVALEEMLDSTAKEAQDRARAALSDKDDQLCELSRALAVLASASSVTREREEFLRLVNKEIELYNSVVDKEGIEREAEAEKAYKAAHEDEEELDTAQVSSALTDKVDAMLQKLEKEIDDVDARIGDRWRLLDRDHDGKVTPEEVASAAAYLKSTLDKDGIQKLISKLSKDRDGKILVDDIVRLASHNDNEEAESEK
ncbi:Mitochondrial proton/calcium exchanger protein [Bienertia sinuspersici]